MKLLAEAELAGVLRWVLKGASAAFQKIELEATAWDSPTAKRLRERREIVVRRVVSLLMVLDTETKVEVVNDLIGDLHCRSSKESCERANQAGLAIEPDERAGFGMLLMLRQVVPACCELVRNGNEEFVTELVLYAADLVKTLDEVARQKPQLFYSVASERIDWPIMASRHYPKKADFKKLAETYSACANKSCSAAP